MGNETANKRRFGRLRCEDLRSNLGPVIDLSGLGARLRCRRRRCPAIGDEVSVELRGADCQTRIQGVVVWRSPIRLREHQIGVRFETVEDEPREALMAIVRTHRVRQTMPWAA